jgi:N-acetylglucosaminyl-diphospho-decaprenol L-rhamnosyltransferase
VLVFLNPDATIGDESLRALANRAVMPHTGLVGPRIYDDESNEATSPRNWSRPIGDALHLLLPTRFVPARWNRDIPHSDPRYVMGGSVAYVQGSCMAISREAFVAVGGFDEEFFLYGEEEDLACRLVQLGRSSLLEPDASASHVGATSTSELSLFAARQLFRSHVLIYHKHLGRSMALWGAALLAAALLILLFSTPVRARMRWRQRETSPWCRAALRGTVEGLLRMPVVPPPAAPGPAA